MECAKRKPGCARDYGPHQDLQGCDKGPGRLRVVLPEGQDERVLHATEQLREQDLAFPILLSDPATGSNGARYARLIAARRPKMTEGMASRLVRSPLYFGGAMVAAGDADAMVAGISLSDAAGDRG